MQNLKYIDTVKGGKLPNVQKAIGELLKTLEGKKITITIGLYKKERSNKQNRYLFGVVYPLILNQVNEYGNDMDIEELHEFLAAEVGKLKDAIILPDGIKLVRKSTRKLTTVEFEEYLLKLRMWAMGTLDLNIPLPNEV